MKKIKFLSCTPADADRYVRFIEANESATVFHRLPWLEAAAAESGYELSLVLGMKKDNVVLALPVFTKSFLGIKTVFSPPPQCAIRSLGPVIGIAAGKREKVERAYCGLIAECSSFIEDQYKPDYMQIKLFSAHNDARPYLWAGNSVRPLYTYTIDATQPADTVFGEFQSQARTLIRKAEGCDGLTVQAGGHEDYRSIMKMVRSRFIEQGESPGPSEAYLDRIYSQYSDELVILKCEYRGVLQNGIVGLKSNGAVLFWAGGVHPKNPELKGVNELLHWKMIQWCIADEQTNAYDLVGANTAHLCAFKLKFNPSLDLYFNVSNTSRKGALLLKLRAMVK